MPQSRSGSWYYVSVWFLVSGRHASMWTACVDITRLKVWRRLCTCIAAEPPPYCSHRRGVRCSCADAHRARIYAGYCLAVEHQVFMALSCKASCGLCSAVAPVPVPSPCVDVDSQCGTYKAQGARSCCRLYAPLCARVLDLAWEQVSVSEQPKRSCRVSAERAVACAPLPHHH